MLAVSAAAATGRAAADVTAAETGTADAVTTEAQPLPRRTLGRTGETVTALGLGGSHVINQKQTAKQSQAIIEAGLAAGVRFFDTAVSYGKGKSEQRYGDFLTPKHRDQIYLMTKTGARNAKAAKRDLDGSRKRMGVDVIDLWQMHSITDAEDVDGRIDEGVLDVFLEARAAGTVRHLGFTGHTTTAAFTRMFERLDALGIELDALQMPMNVIDPGYESFIERVLPVAVEKNYAVLAMKTLVHGRITGFDDGWRKDDVTNHRLVPGRVSLAEALGFVWSLPISTLVSGMIDPAMVTENAELTRAFTPLSEAERVELVERCAGEAGRSAEYYKA